MVHIVSHVVGKLLHLGVAIAHSDGGADDAEHLEVVAAVSEADGMLGRYFVVPEHAGHRPGFAAAERECIDEVRAPARELQMLRVLGHDVGLAGSQEDVELDDIVVERLVDILCRHIDIGCLEGTLEELIASAHIALRRLHEGAAVEALVYLVDDDPDIVGVDRLLEDHAVAVQDELAIEEDEGLHVLDIDHIDLIGRASCRKEALDACPLELVQRLLRRFRYLVRRKRQERSVCIEECCLYRLCPRPAWHGLPLPLVVSRKSYDCLVSTAP